MAVVHNGIIENYQSLREKLEGTGHTFESEIDTEVVLYLIEDTRETGTIFETGLRQAVSRLEESYAVAAIVEGYGLRRVE